ncbi:hypothetical protein B0H11DRAFT_566114 [Mycena galericulata]|nr:hypothetical protein B0H11DRAFT_566114 [Mycena galericulata]
MLPLAAWRISLFFDPDLVRSASYGKLSLSIKAPRLLVPKDAIHSTSVTLPWNGYNHYTQIQQIGTYICTENRNVVPIIAITVGLPAATGLVTPRSVDQKLERALVDTMEGKEAVDVKFYAFSRRNSGYVARPQAVFAKSSLVEGYSDSLDLLISGGGFTEARIVDLDEQNIDENLFENYDYMSDSDLDSDSDGEDMDEAVSIKSVLSDSDSAQAVAPEPENIPLPASRPASPLAKSSRRMGRVVSVRGTAFKTWKALVYYLYTSKLSFSINDISTVPPLFDEYRIPQCSAKSMYRLADQFGLDDLKALSLSAIRARLSQDNIIREVFSKFTSMYPDVQDFEVAFLLENYHVLKDDVDDVLEGLCKGRQPHCADVLRKIVEGRNRIKAFSFSGLPMTA